MTHRSTQHTQSIIRNRMMMVAGGVASVVNQGNVNENENMRMIAVNMIDIKAVRNIAKRIDIIDLGMEISIIFTC